MDAKWYADWIRMIPASTPEEKLRNLEAADMLEQLANQMPRWISVEERMPPIDAEVLVFATEKIKGFGETYALCRYEKAINIFGQETGRLEWDSPWDYFHTDYKITHWMPLPEPPKDTKGD